MKTVVMSRSAAVLMMAAVTSASAVTCVEGDRRAECVGREGVAAVRKPAPEVVAPRKEVVAVPEKEVVRVPEKEEVAGPCRMVEGRRVCR